MTQLGRKKTAASISHKNANNNDRFSYHLCKINDVATCILAKCDYRKIRKTCQTHSCNKYKLVYILGDIFHHSETIWLYLSVTHEQYLLYFKKKF